jgi:hypothetical protein
MRALDEMIGDGVDREMTTAALRNFYLTSSEFVSGKKINKIPSTFIASKNADHFILSRFRDGFTYSVDSYSLNDTFYERVVIKVAPAKPSNSSPILTLFLVPSACNN